MKRCLSLLLTVVLLLGVFSVPASAKSSAKTELLTEKVLYKSTGYNLASNSGPYLKMSVSCKQVDKSFLFIKYKKYISSVRFEVFEDKKMTVRIADYRSKEWETFAQKNVEDIVNHDPKLKSKKVYDLICEISRLDNEIVIIKPACDDNNAMQTFLINQCVISLYNSSATAFTETVNEIVDNFSDEIKSTVESSLVGTAASCIKEIKDINESAYDSPYKKHWFEVFVEWVLAYDTNSDKQSAPDIKDKSIIAQAYEKSMRNSVNVLGRINYIVIDRIEYEFSANDDSNFATYKKHYKKILDDDMAILPVKHKELCDIIISLD